MAARALLILISATLALGLVACGGTSPKAENSGAAATAATKPPPAPPEAPVILELVRHPPAGTRWHEVRTYSRGQDAAMGPARFAHHYHDELEADVAVVEQSATREIVELAVTRHESMVDGRPYPGVQAPGARVRIEQTLGKCKATDGAGTPLGDTALDRLFSHVLDCGLDPVSDNDDDFFGMRTAHRAGETWSMSRSTLASTLRVADADITRAAVTLDAAKDSFVLTASYAVPSAGASGTFRKVVPRDPNLPLLENQVDVIRETHERLRRSTVRTMR